MAKTLLIIPDYCIGELPVNRQDAVARSSMLGEPLPSGVLDADDANERAALMQRLTGYRLLLVHTPQASYYTRICELKDTCFFVDITLRALSRGADVRINTGMVEASLPGPLRACMDTLRSWGAALTFEQALYTPTSPIELVTAKEIESCRRAGRQLLIAAKGAVITPGAWDAAKDFNITIKRIGQEA